MNILVVEDNELTRKGLVKAVHKAIEACHVYEAESGTKAVEYLEANKIDIFMLDVELPDFSGLEVAKKIRAIEKYEFTPIIFITSHVITLPIALQQYHCYDFIEKPFKMDKIVTTVKQLSKGVRHEDKSDGRQYLTVTKGIMISKIFLSDLVYVETLGRHVIYHTKSGQIKEANQSLKKILDKLGALGATNFIRSHKAFIINIDLISRVERTTRSSGNVYFHDFEGVAMVGEAYKDGIVNYFN